MLYQIYFQDNRRFFAVAGESFIGEMVGIKSAPDNFWNGRKTSLAENPRISKLRDRGYEGQ